MKIVTLSKEEFDNFAINHKYNSYYQSPEYANFKKITEGYESSYLGFLDDDRNLVGASMFLYKELFWKYKYAYAPRGMLLDYDDYDLVISVTTELRRLLKKQKFIFVKIDPPIIASERDKEGNIVNFNSTVNNILSVFKNNGYEHLGFNLYDESLLPRWNVIAKLNMDARITFNNFDSKIKGFNDSDVLLAGVESRTSSPIKIIRNEFFESNISGIYPAGEGCGYAGGIVSAAVDGIKVFESIVSKYKKF